VRKTDYTAIVPAVLTLFIPPVGLEELPHAEQISPGESPEARVAPLDVMGEGLDYAFTPGRRLKLARDVFTNPPVVRPRCHPLREATVIQTCRPLPSEPSASPYWPMLRHRALPAAAARRTHAGPTHRAPVQERERSGGSHTRDLEFPGDQAILRKEGDRLIVEPMPRPSLLELSSTWEPLDEEFPEIEDLEPVEDVDL